MRERSPGVWELRVSLGRDPTGKLRQRSVTFRGGKRAAATRLAQLVADTAEDRAPDTDSTVGHLLDEWLRLAERDLSPTTLGEYRRLIAKRIKPALGTQRLASLTPRQIDELYRTMGAPKPAGEGLAPGSVHQVHSILRRACNQAVRWGWIDSSPVKRATPPRRRRSEVEPPELAVLWRIVDEAEQEDPTLAVVFLVAAAIGARRSELIGLRWRDVDFDGAVVRIHRGVVSVAGRSVEKDTKTHAARNVELDALTVGLLRRHRQAMEDRAAAFEVALVRDAFVFSIDPSGRRPIRPERATKAFARIRDKVGAPESLRLHDLRHLNASMLLEAGVPITEVSKRLGHAKTSTTLDVYAHLMPGQRGAGPGAVERALKRPD